MRERAEPDSFLAFRPWLTVLVVFTTAFATQGSGRAMVGAVALFALAATLSEGAIQFAVGHPDLWLNARALLASAALGTAVIMVAMLFHRLFGHGRTGAVAALLFSVGMLALRPPLPAPMQWFEGMIRPPVKSPQPAGDLRLALMTDLPLIWGAGTAEDVLGGSSPPPAIMDALIRSGRVLPMDMIDPVRLQEVDVLVLAQPRALRPVELAHVDDWVRAGGRALIFVDPALHWARDLPPNLRRPPGISLLGPLLDHWGVGLRPGPPGFRMVSGASDGLFGARRIGVGDPGILWAMTQDCRISGQGLVAQCRIGRGRATIIADADLLRDESWVGPGPMGAARAGRIADNAVFVRGAVAELAEKGGAHPAADDIRWISRPDISPGLLIITGLFIPAVLAGLAWGIARRAKRR